jgi:hypothetical protein
MEDILIIKEQEITAIAFQEEWLKTPLVIYPSGLGAVRDLIGLIPQIKRFNVRFYFDCAMKESYDAVQILSSLGICSGILINENADWERLTDLMYYALCSRVARASIEPFQYLYDIFSKNTLVDYGEVYLEEKTETGKQKAERHEGTKEILRSYALTLLRSPKKWQEFFYRATPCAACPGWRICLGKYANLKDKTGCQNFTIELLDLLETTKAESINH